MGEAHARLPRRRVDGLLLLDKPAGLSSNAALQRARSLFRAEKAGHTGTLDPAASGLLPLCFGEATKFAHALLDAPKRYVATVEFGTATDTGDREGAITGHGPVPASADVIAAVLPRFTGRIEQVPPRFAALKYQGRKFYEYARAGQDVPRVPRSITILSLALLEWNPPRALIDVHCSKGTYVRTLAEDIAAALGTCGHLAALRRTRTGSFDVAEAATLEAIGSLAERDRDARLLPIDAALASVPRVALDRSAVQALMQGRRIGFGGVEVGPVALYGPDGAFVGLGEAGAGEIRPARMVRQDSAPATLAA